MYYEVTDAEKKLREALRKVDKARKCLDAVRVLCIEGYNVDALESDVSKEHNEAIANLREKCAGFLG